MNTQSLLRMGKIYDVDEFGVRNYNTNYLAGITLITLYGIIAASSMMLVYFEQASATSNIERYGDAFWVLMLSASTIGFGDFYPVTFGGRVVVALIFYIGVGMVGFVGAQVVTKFVGFSDTSVKNRELRRQNDEMLKHNKQLEEKIDQLIGEIQALIAVKQ